MNFKMPQKLTVGIDIVDSAHAKLFDYIFRVEEIILQENPYKDESNMKTARYVLNRLMDYTVSHFAEEELLMEMYKAPNRMKHKKAHRVLEQKLVELYRRFEVEGLNALPDLVSFLKVWWQSHIVQMDMKDLEAIQILEPTVEFFEDQQRSRDAELERAALKNAQ